VVISRARCWCRRPVPATSLDGTQCAEHDSPLSWHDEQAKERAEYAAWLLDRQEGMRQ
jgi:hypothetical protein